MLETNSMGQEPSLNKSAENTKDHARNIGYPVAHVGAAAYGFGRAKIIRLMTLKNARQ